MTRLQSAFALTILLAPASLGAQGDSQPEPAVQTPVFPAEVEQVVVDAVVIDKKGMVVRGLTPEDFTVFEDGVEQTVLSFDAVELPAEPVTEAVTRPEPPRISVNNVADADRGRTFVIVFDDVHMIPWKANPAKAAVASFLRNAVREGDRVSLISTSGDAWWSARMLAGRDGLIDLVRRIEGRRIPEVSMDRISDWEAMRIHLYRDAQVYARVLRRFQTYNAAFARSQSGNVLDQETIEDPYITQRAAETYYQAGIRLQTTLNALERALNGVVGVRGRKSVILVSEGFIYDPHRDEYRYVKEAARRANAAIYFLNSLGLQGLPAELTAEFGGVLDSRDVGLAIVDAVDAVAGSEDVSTSSGGFVISNTNDLAGGIERIARETQAYYLLGYVSGNPARDGDFREIKVKLRNGKGLKVRARKGYYAPTESGEIAVRTKEGVDPEIQAALDSPWAEGDIPLRMTHYVGDEGISGKAVALVATEVDIRGFDLEEQAGRHKGTIEFLLVVAHRETGEFFRFDQSVVMNFLPATCTRYERLWLPIVRDFELRPGDYQAKIVVRDTGSGRVGSVIHDFEVSELAGFRVSTPVLSDALSTERPVSGAPGARLEVMVRREFEVGSTIYCQVDIFGAARDKKSRMPWVSHGYLVRRPDGTIFNSVPPSEIGPTSLGYLSRTSGFSLAGAEPGEHELTITVRDELSDETLELVERFEVVAAEPTQTSENPKR